ncbi:hypothetical protein L1887_29902 [Cichorium endivia]|nr:hypothetical protein L1887_29902 [Cichorium endivia]
MHYVAPCFFAFLSIPWIIVEFPKLRDTSSFHFDYLIFGTIFFVCIRFESRGVFACWEDFSVHHERGQSCEGLVVDCALKAKEAEKKATQVDDESGKLLEEKSAENQQERIKNNMVNHISSRVHEARVLRDFHGFFLFDGIRKRKLCGCSQVERRLGFCGIYGKWTE